MLPPFRMFLNTDFFLSTVTNWSARVYQGLQTHSPAVCRPVVIHQIEREFAELDMDHDGYITAEDLVAASRAGIRLQARTKPAAGVKTGSNYAASSSPTASTAADAGSNVELAPVVDSVSDVLHEVVHAALGSELTLAEAAAMLDEVDQKHQGKISLAEVRSYNVSDNTAVEHRIYHCQEHDARIMDMYSAWDGLLLGCWLLLNQDLVQMSVPLCIALLYVVWQCSSG
jgi:hypothetical protein